MKVYVLQLSIPYEGSELCGIYSTEENAKVALIEMCTIHKEFKIEENGLTAVDRWENIYKIETHELDK